MILDKLCQKLANIFWYWIYSANNWGINSDVGYILPTIGKYILVLDIFRQQLADIFWYWIVSAKNWEIYVNYGVIVHLSGAGLQIVHLLECVSFFEKHILQPYTSNWQISPNCWQNISNNNIWIQLTYIPNC